MPIIYGPDSTADPCH
ncbi:hypothetical protein RLOC_00010863 [Lonchura striata]|uniref:Uncharacterized protein n=2 Tax=Passeriformes TaxID=9126 RepID=A0A218UXI3_9PASE|nr:hypothetical protein RLOC_00010863 [Lonchura striata domestica]